MIISLTGAELDKILKKHFNLEETANVDVEAFVAVKPSEDGTAPVAISNLTLWTPDDNPYKE